MSERPYSTTGIADYQRCARRYYYQRELGYKPRYKSRELVFGDWFHKGLEAWFVAAWWGQRKGRIKAALYAVQGCDDAYMRAMLEVLLIGYNAMWDGAPVKVEHIERSFTHTLANGAVFRGVIDAEVSADEGFDYDLIEHKTTSSEIHSGAEYWTNLRLDAQVSNYLLASDTNKMLYDVVRKPSIKLGNSETPEQYKSRLVDVLLKAPSAYYQRRVVVRLQAEREEAEANLISATELIRFSRKHNHWPQSPGACGRFGERCEFWRVCTRETTLDNAGLYEKRANADA